MSRLYGIGDLAREFAVTARTLRHYEDEGLLTPLRDGRKRLYRPRDRVRLKLILRGKRLGFSLRDIAEIIDLHDAPAGEAGQLDTLLSRIAARRGDLESKRRDIEAALAHLDDVAADCERRLAALDESKARDSAA